MSRRKKPSKINVLGTELTIKFAKESEDGTLGAFHADAYLMYLLNQPMWEKTLLHEVLHAIIHYSGWGSKMDDKDEEGLVRALETGLWPLIKLKL